jgi:hypothetical protein
MFCHAIFVGLHLACGLSSGLEYRGGIRLLEKFVCMVRSFGKFYCALWLLARKFKGCMNGGLAGIILWRAYILALRPLAGWWD